MTRQRSDAEQQVAELLRTAKQALGMSVAFLTRMDGATQYLEVVESSVPFLFKEGNQQVQETSLCQAILDKKAEVEGVKLPDDVRSFMASKTATCNF